MDVAGGMELLQFAYFSRQKEGVIGVDVAGQNYLFNIFYEEDLKKALQEIYRVLKSRGRLVMSDPIAEQAMHESLKYDERLRGLCLSGAIPLKDYVKMITDVGFGTIEIRAKRPYRILDSKNYDTNESIFVESVEVCAIKDPMPEDSPCVFTGRTAIYTGEEECFDDHKGHVLLPNKPLSVSDKTEGNLEALKDDNIWVSPSTYFNDGGGLLV